MNKKYISVEGKQGRTIIAKLKPGQDLVEGISQILKDKKIKAGYIPVLLGGFKHVTLDSMKPGEDVNHPIDVTQEFSEPLEYFGEGTIAEVGGEPSLHIHLTAARTGNNGITGHLVSGEIVFVAEIVIVEIIGSKIIRKADNEVYGLPLLTFEDEK